MFTNLFDNVGGKLKVFARFVFTFNFVSAVIGAVCVLVGHLNRENFGGFILAPLIVAAGYFVAWLSALGIYAFGQLVENSDRTVSLLEEADTARRTEERKRLHAEMANKNEK